MTEDCASEDAVAKCDEAGLIAGVQVVISITYFNL